MFDTGTVGPFYEDFVVGGTVPPLPPITLTEADNAIFRAVTGDQCLFASDESAYRRASGAGGRLANPGMVMQYSIGQTTMATRQAVANLYYRSVRFLRPVELGETLQTETTVLGLRDSAPKGDQFRGKVWLGIRTRGDAGPVVEYERCALVRGRGQAQPGHVDDIPGPAEPAALATYESLVPDWDLRGAQVVDWMPDEVRVDPLRDHIDLAPALVRLTFNQAAIHRDPTTTADGYRLVYGGHVQALAQASLTRMLPGLAHVVAWDGCDHLGPAHEGDLLEFRHRMVDRVPAGSGHLLRFDVVGATVDDAADILRWTPIVWAP